MKKKVTGIVLATMMLFSLAGCEADGCGVGLRLYENEYFIYTISYDSNEISILGLTDKGKEQEYLVIPETIDNKDVTHIIYGEIEIRKIAEKYGDEKYSGLQSDCLKKVFIVPEIEVYNGTFFRLATNSLSVFYISNDVYIQETVNRYDYYYTKDNDANSTGGIRNHKANVSYYYNYENAPNDGYYWIDNYNYGETIEYIPVIPVRDGYTFGGWYKETECINAWNFEIDALPEVQYDEEEMEIYQETKLYAKWI